MKRHLSIFLMLLTVGLMACSSSENPLPEPTPTPSPTPTPGPASAFVKGADLSWVTEMEDAEIKFRNSEGTETDCFKLMKDLGMTLIRLRVWVNPESTYGKWCDKADVVAKAERAKNAGMDVMIDFHYSDVFADPGKQTKPVAWKDFGQKELKKSVENHTTEVLQALKNKGIEPKYIQIGNETRNGMLWPSGQLWDEKGDLPNGWKNYVELSNAGYEAAKNVFSNAKVMVHLNNAYEDLDWWFKNFKQNGGKFDMIGLSHYPFEAYEDAVQMDPVRANNLAIAHITSLGKTYGVKVLVAEVGVKVQEGNSPTILKNFMEVAKQNEMCEGVVYWEPEYYSSAENNWWKPAYYEIMKWNSYDMGAFSQIGTPTSILDCFKN